MAFFALPFVGKLITGGAQLIGNLIKGSAKKKVVAPALQIGTKQSGTIDMVQTSTGSFVASSSNNNGGLGDLFKKKDDNTTIMYLLIGIGIILGLVALLKPRSR